MKKKVPKRMSLAGVAATLMLGGLFGMGAGAAFASANSSVGDARTMMFGVGIAIVLFGFTLFWLIVEIDTRA